MSYVETRDIPLADIDVGARLRPVDPDEVLRIRESMAENGQLTPIAVGALANDRFRLIAGAHRLTAARELEWETIRAEVKHLSAGPGAEIEAQLQEIDENLGRFDLNPLDRAVFIGHRRELYKQLHPERIGQGGDRRSENIKAKVSPRFADEVAGLIGKSDDVVKRSVRIWEHLSPETLQKLRGTRLARNEGELYRLTRYSAEQQAQIIDRCLTPVRNGEKTVFPSVGQVGAELDGEATPPRPAHVIEAAKLRDAWDRAGGRARTAHLQFLVEIGVIDAFRVEHL